MANYPTSLDNFNNPTGADSLSSPSHSLQHADANDAIEALETKVGVGNSPAGSATAGHVLVASTGGTTSWTTVGTAGINSTGASAGQVLTANTSGAPSWATPAVTNDAWTAYTPTFLNFTLGNGTITARYIKLGKSVFYSIFITLGSTSSVTGQILVSTPVNPQTNSIYFNTFMLDISASSAYFGVSEISGGYLYLRAVGAGGTYATTIATSGTIPFTWAVNDQISIAGTYEED